LLEGKCKNPACAFHEVAVEHFYWHSDDPTAPCDICGGPTERCMSRFAVVFTGVISARYNDPKLEGAHKEGHVVWGKDPVTGKTVHRRVETFDDQKRVCREFGYINPREAPTHFEVAEDGRTTKNTRGLPGSWV
jgi:predicted nucleic acid-binding Zn ribbon protein